MTGLAEDPLPSAEPSTLERRYRRVLRVLPRAYREAREQEMVDTFLDSTFGADPENADLAAKFGGAGWRETASVLALAVRLRWADPLGPERYRIRQAALRMTLVAVLTMLALEAVISLLDLLWQSLWPIVPVGPVASPGVSPDLLWQRASRWSFVLWIPALVLAVRAGRLGGRRSGWWAAAVSLVPTAVAMVRAAGSPTVSAWEWVSVLIDVAVVAGLATSAMADAHPKDAHPTDPHPTDADPTGARPWDWIIVAAAAVVVWEVATVVLMVASPTWSRVPDWLTAVMGATVPDNLALWTFALLVVGATLLARAARGTRVGTERVLALALVAAVISLLRTGSLLDWTPLLSGSWTAGMASVTVGLSCQLLLSIAVAVTAGVVAARRIRRLPAVHYSYADPAGPRATA